ncbi:hypothetical protein ABK040_008796 [Willaertia magna]
MSQTNFVKSSQRSYMEDDEGMQPVEKEVNEEDMDDKDILRILITTDNHLGYLERDPIRKDDSFIIFEEILEYAKQHNVDFILQGGDLFQDNKPSRDTLHRAITILRKYVFGDRPLPLQILSDQEVNFKSNPKHVVNYEDPNVNISLPIFAISGNHDGWSGENNLSVLDILSQCDLINYFGKSETVDQIQVKPILIQKGETKLSLYGLGYIRDERLYQTFKNQKITFYRPQESGEEWFNLFILHQNHNQLQNKKGNISDSMLKGFFDLVIYGHEHEQLIVPTRTPHGFDVMQPGSSIVTSYTPQEGKTKKVAIIEIYKDQYRTIPLPLKSVRPYIFDTITLSDYKDDLKHVKNNSDEIAQFLKEHVEELIEQAKQGKWNNFEHDKKEKEKLKEIYKQYPNLELPIVKLKVDYSGYASVNPQRFGSYFIGKVANPSDLLTMTRKKTKVNDSKSNNDQEDVENDKNSKKSKDQILKAIVNNDNDELLEAAGDALTEGIKIEDLVAYYLRDESNSKEGLSVLNTFELQNSVIDYVDKEELHSIDDFVKADIKEKQKKLWTDIKKKLKDSDETITEDDIHDLLSKYKLEEKAEYELRQDQRILDRIKGSKSKDNKDEEEEEEEEEEKPKKKRSTRKKKDESEEEEEEEEKPKKKRSSSKKKKDESEEEEKPKKKKSTRGKKKVEDEEEEEEEKPKRGRKKASSSTTTTKKSASKSKSSTTKRSTKFKSLDLVEDEEEEEIPTKSRSKRGAKRKTKEESDDEEKTKKKKTSASTDNDDVIVLDDE